MRRQLVKSLAIVIGVNVALVFRNTWLGNTIIIFIIKQICWNQGHVDLTVHNTALLDIWWKYDNQI